MQKHYKLLFLVAILFAPWAMRGQFLETCAFNTGVDTSRWIQLSSPSYVWSSYTDDSYSNTLNLGFTFTIDGVPYTTFSVSSNGIFNLGGGAVGTTVGGQFTSSYYTTSLPKICGIARDLGTGYNGHVRYQLVDPDPNVDSDRVFVCEYAMGPTWGDDYSADVKWQVQLHENGGRIVIVYGPQVPSTTPSSFQIGIGLAADDIMIINPTSNTPVYSNGPYESTFSTWPGASRYYELTPSVVTCPKPIAARVDNITNNTCDFHWTDTTLTTEWLVRVTTGSTIFDTLVYDTAISFNNLLTNTEYTMSVASVCGMDDTSLWRNVTFRTPCGTLATMPFTEGFESAELGSSTSGTFVTCWTRLNNGSSYYGYPYVSSTSSYCHSGIRGLYWYNSTTTGTYGDYQCVILPPVDTSIQVNTLQLSFWAKTTSTSYNPTLFVGVLTDANDINTFQTVATLNVNNNTAWDQYTVDLSSYTGAGQFIAIRANRPGSSWYIGLDDVMLDFIPTCPAVDSLAARAITTSSARIEWDEQDTATTWNIEYGPTGFNPGTGTTLTATTDTFTIAGLLPNTTYDVYVLPVCSDNLSGRASITFRTNCIGLDTLPYIEDFEGQPTGGSQNTTFLECWRRLNNGSSYFGYPYVSSSAIYSHNTGTKGLYWYNTTTASTYGDYMCIALPGVDTSVYPMNTLQLTFWARSSSTSYNPTFQVGVMTDPNDYSTFQQVSSINVGNSTAWGEYVTTFEDYTGTGFYPAIRTTRASSSWYCYMDEIRLEEIPDCPHVQDLAATRMTSNSARLSWDEDGTATSWTVEYGTTGFTRGTGTTVTATADTLVLTGLNSGTTYDVYVTPECSGTAIESFVQFTTLCNYLDSLPYYEDFENATTGGTYSHNFVPCWTRLNNGTMYFGYPYVSSSSSYSHNGGTKGLYWYNTTTAATYGDYQYVVLPEADPTLYPINTLQLRFWAKASSTSYHPSFDIGVMTDPNDPTTFETVSTFNVNGTDWQECFTAFTTYSGSGNFVAVRATRPTSSWYAYVDEFTLELADPCADVYNMTVNNVGFLGASIEWNTRGGFEEIVNFDVELINLDSTSGESPMTDATSEYSYTFTSLTPGAQYMAKVRANCGSETGRWDSIIFTTMTLPCAVFDSTTMDTIIFSNSTSSGTSGIMVYSGYGNTVCQTIYTAAELTAAGLTAGPIIGIDLGFTQNSSYAKEFTIMMANTNKSTFSSSTDMENMAHHSLVYGPQPHPLNTSGWQHYSFDEPFNWDGSSNIIMTTFMNQPAGTSHASSSFYGYYTTGTGTRLAYRYQDSQPYTTSNYTGGSSGGTSSSRPSIHFYTGQCIEYASCLPSIAWVSSNDSNGVELSWMASYLEDNWTLEYREIDSTEWHLVADNLTDNSYLIEGLEDATFYQLRLSHYCGDSTYETIVEVRTPGIYNMPTSGSDTIIACRTIIYDNGGPDNSYANNCDGTLVIYPSDTSRTLRISGTFAGEGCCDYLGIYDGVGDSRRTLFYGNCTSSGQTMQLGPFTSELGAITITFHSDGSVVYPGFELRAACIPIPHCADIHYVTAETVGTQAANVKWLNVGNSRYGDPAGFEYICYDSLRTEIAHDTTSALSHFFTGLTPESEYTVLVRTLCPGDEQYGVWDSVSFTTASLPCVEIDTSVSRTVPFSDGTTTATGVFITSAWGNSFCQSIYTAAELNDAGITGGLITGITLGYSSAGTYNKDLTIFLTTTSNDGFTSSSQSVQIDSSMIVYGPATHSNSVTGWVTYTFDTPFAWDGSSNLVLTTTMNQPDGASHSSSNFMAYATDCGTTRTIYRYRDSNPWTISNYSSGNSSTSTYRPSVSFGTTGCSVTGTCASPTVIIDSVGFDHIGIQWAPGYYETQWQVAYRPSNDTTWVDLGSTTNTSMNITGLTPDMSYRIRVTALCSDTNLARTISARTICLPTPLPFAEDFESWTPSSTTPLPACWARLSSYSSGNYPYTSSGYSVYPGSNSLYYYATGSTHTTLILPYFDTPIDSINLSFWLMRTNTSYSHAVRVGVMTDPTEFETFVEVGQAVPTANLYEFEPFEFTFENYHGSGKYIAISTTSNDSYCYPYLDNIEVNREPACPRVSGVTLLGATLTSATIGWDTSTTPTYDIEYGPAGYTRGTGTRINGITAYNVTINGLTPGTEYDVYVRGNCLTDSSLWSFQYTFLTECLLIDSLPFADDLETWRPGNSQSTRLHPCWTRLTDATTYYGYPYLSNSSSYSHGSGTKGLYWYRSSSTGSYGSYNGIVLPGIDTSVISIDTVELSFWARNSSSSYVARFTIGVLTDPSDYSTFTPYDTVVVTSTDWTNILVPFNSYSGYGNYIGILTAYDGSYYYTYVDDFNLHYTPPCLLANLRKDTDVRSSDTRLAVKWDDNGAALYQAVCTPAGMPIDSGIVINTTTPNAIFSSLRPNSFYDIYARGICNSTDTGRWISITLQTDLCPNLDEVIIGNVSSSSTSYNAPVNNFYRYTLSETIIDASELANTTTIEYLGYYYDYSTPSSDKTNCTIYFQPTNKTSFSSSTDLELLDTSIATLVYTGNLNCSQGWNLFPLNTPYTYSGTGNLMIIVDDNSNAYDGSAYVFRTSSTSSYKTLTWYSDSYDASPTSTSYSGSKTYYQWRPLMRLVACAPGCPAPYNVADTHDYRSATFTWQGEGANYQVNLKDTAATDWPATDQTVLGTTCTFPNLLPATTYTFRVRQDCTSDSLDYSEWVYYTFTTDSLDCYTPDSLRTVAVTNATATFDWNVLGSENTWDIHVWLPGGLDSIYRVTTRPVTVGGFIPGLTYNASIRSLCGADLLAGEWGDTVTFATATCPDVTNFTTSNVTTNSVTLNWTADPMAQGWIIEYGFLGFNQGTGTTVNVTTNSYVATGLLDETDYQFYIRAVCGTDWTSENWASATATTQSGGVPCGVPTGVSATAADNSITVNWTSGTGNLSFEIEYGPSGFNHGSGIVTSAATAPATLNNLEYETPYDIYVRAICDQNTYSGWSIVATATTGQRPSEDCQPVTNLTVTDITDHTAHVAWTPAPETDSWQVVVTDPQGNDVVDQRCAEPFYDLTGLTEGTNYTVKVRTDCGDGNVSAFVSTNFRTTGGVGISDVTTASCTIFPNPTSNATTISVSGVNGRVKIEVVDMNGRVAASETLECSTDCTKTMDVDRLAQGAYFVRITADNVNMVRKLIVR